MGQYSYSQPSSSSADSVKSRDRTYGKYGIPTRCWCDGAVKLHTRDSGKDQGRLFYECERTGTGGLHISKWWDKAIMEELRDIQVKSLEQDDRISYLSYDPKTGDRVDPRCVWHQLHAQTEELNLFKQMLEGCAEDVAEMKEFLVEISEERKRAFGRKFCGRRFITTKGFKVGLIVVAFFALLLSIMISSV